MRDIRYAVVTPARDEIRDLPRLAEALAAQEQVPDAWVVVDNGSSDGTAELVQTLAERLDWIHAATAEATDGPVRGGPVVRAFIAGLETLECLPDVVVKLDADISFAADYFARLLDRFATNEKLGIASGTCHEQDPDGVWRERGMASGSVWGATRAYRRACLADVEPLDAEMGWDGIDVLKANLSGWETQTFRDIPFRHHRAEGARDGRRTAAWAAQGRASHYMGYRPSFLVLRSIYHARREPAALAMIGGYARAAVMRSQRHADDRVRSHLRDGQRLRSLFSRLD